MKMVCIASAPECNIAMVALAVQSSPYLKVFASFAEARNAALAELLRQWHKPFPGEPQTAHNELRIMREQIESQLREPKLL